MRHEAFAVGAVLVFGACGGGAASPVEMSAMGGSTPAATRGSGTGGTGTGGASAVGSGGMFSLPPPPTNPAPANSSLEFEFTDSCLDGETFEMRFFDEDTGIVWPVDSLTGGVLTGHGDGHTDKVTLACIYGDKICFGADSYPTPAPGFWGVDVDNSENCMGCCHACGQITPIMFNMTCN